MMMQGPLNGCTKYRAKQVILDQGVSLKGNVKVTLMK